MRINIEFLADETGLKRSKEPYICSACGKKINYEKVQNSGWYYKINIEESELIYPFKDKIGYTDLKNISYLCKKHYKKLSAKNAFEFVEVGLPYFLSRLGKQGGVFSF